MPIENRFRNLECLSSVGNVSAFLAVDTELNRKVILRKLEPADASAGSEQAFLDEAKRMGQLQHPGVPSVYARGVDEKENPYYALRWIEGRTLSEAIRDLHQQSAITFASELRGLLRRFIDGCNTIAYAHSQKVVHGDIRADHFLLGKFGETQIIDWANARPLKHDESGSQSSSNASDSIKPQTVKDISRLGDILEQLLTGDSGTDSDSDSDSQDAQLRKNAGIPKSLLAICEKAKTTGAPGQYDSITDFVQDLERYLADEPTTARPDSVLEKLARWTRHHQTVSTTLLTALIVAIIGVSCGLLLVNNARENERLAKVEESQAKRLAENREAESQDFYRMARDAVDQLLARIAEEPLLETAAFETFRRSLLVAAKDFYDELISARPSDPALKKDLGQAHRRLALIHTDLGEHQHAFAEFKLATAVYSELAMETPDAKILSSFGEINSEWAIALKDHSSFENAEEYYLESIEWGRKAVKQSGNDKRYLRYLGQFLTNLGSYYLSANRHRDAERVLREAIEALEASRPLLAGYQDVYRGARVNLSIALDATGNREEAIGLKRDVLAEREAIVKRFPQRRDARAVLAQTQLNLGSSLADREGLSLISAAIENLESLSNKFPSVIKYRALLGFALSNRAWLRHRLGESSDVKQDAKDAILAAESVLKIENSHLLARQVIAGANSVLATVLNPATEKQARFDALQDAVHAYLELFKQDAVPGEEYLRFIQAANSFHFELAVQGNGSEIMEGASQAVEIATHLEKKSPDEPYYDETLGLAWLNLFRGQQLTGHEKRIESLDRSIEVFESIKDQHKEYFPERMEQTIKSLKSTRDAVK